MILIPIINRSECMKLLCKNLDSNVYADGDFHIIKSSKVEFKINKTEHPAYPLSCCLKWGTTPVNVDYLNKLSEKLYDETEV